MKYPVIYVFANKGLKMSPGKLAAQVAHAVVLSNTAESESVLKRWTSIPHRTIIILQARDEVHIMNIKRYLLARGFYTYAQIDEGINEVPSHTVTALASKILDKEDEYVESAFSTFELYREKIKINMEIDL